MSMPMMGRDDASALMPEAVNMSMAAKSSDSRRAAGARAHVQADGKVMLHGQKHIGSVHKAGMAWRARSKGGNVIGLHGSKQEAAGALVLHHERSSY